MTKWLLSYPYTTHIVVIVLIVVVRVAIVEIDDPRIVGIVSMRSRTPIVVRGLVLLFSFYHKKCYDKSVIDLYHICRLTVRGQVITMHYALLHASWSPDPSLLSLLKSGGRTAQYFGTLPREYLIWKLSPFVGCVSQRTNIITNIFWHCWAKLVLESIQHGSA